MDTIGSSFSNTILAVAIKIPNKAISGLLSVAYIRRIAANTANTSTPENTLLATPSNKPKLIATII
jgi:hypothetical protein